ncbi:MAG: adenylate/guanylate cyclase domain-containing protein [Pseudomonadota bacterium]|nr:adenylate/guanylate cyclase domain-containing protein [Pseudomonadota bacterium]
MGLASAEARTSSFDEELDHQSARMLVPGALSCGVLWLPFILPDQALHAEVPVLPWIRVGLTVVSAIVLALHLFARTQLRPQLKLLLLIGYMQIAAGLAAGLVGGDASHIGGYFVVLMILPALPLARRYAMASLVLSLVVFLGTNATMGTDLFRPALRYTLTDLVAVALGVPFLVYFLDQVRRRSWDRSVEIERQRHELAADKARIDVLLHNLLPASIVTELKANDRVEPRHHNDVTVLFTDFVGFTSIAEQVSAEDLVADLDACFSSFDAIVARRGLERLKTIGDSYMAAAGVPVARRTHAADAVLAALDIVRAIGVHSAARAAKGRENWEVRVGLHTGPLVAGIVGQTRFAYDVWGDTVNMASRMESSGSPGCVNISEATAARVSDLFVLQPRGRVAAKHKGLVEMFYVVGIRPEMSVDALGIEPNARFWERARA